MRRFFIKLAIFFWAVLPAQAEDFASRDIIGFSPDGRYFAFEEYGIQDGSGFPYANIYLIDVYEDKWVRGSPFRVRVENEDVSLIDVRNQVKENALDLLEGHNIAVSGEVLVTRRFTDLIEDNSKIRFYPRHVQPPIDKVYEAFIESFKVRDRQMCYDTGIEVGYVLTMNREGGIPILLHEDSGSIPESRSCAQDYRIHDIVTYHPWDGTPVIVFIVQVLRTGFEGPDGRFLAVTSILPE